MAEQYKRRRLDGTNNGTADGHDLSPLKVFPNSPSATATEHDRKHWEGFCEIESEPAFFNVTLKEFGVKGIKVQEVFGLDAELLAMLPKPVYGLIFLFRWRQEDPDKHETSCPENVWFANQTVGNACASVALLNIVNNIPEIELGENLQQFKEFTRDFPPPLRGDQINNFEFVKRIHNSFARKMDMLNGDLTLKNQAKAKKTKVAYSNGDEDDETAGFHFIAFMPIDNQVWKLDGLERQPLKLGDVKGEDWLSLVKPELEARMAAYESDQIEFGLLGLVGDPLLTLSSKLAVNVKTINAVHERLDIVVPEWKDFVVDQDAAAEGVIIGPDLIFGLTQEALDKAVLPTAIQDVLSEPSSSLLIDLRRKLITEQVGLRVNIMEEMQSQRLDEERAAHRRYDYGPAIQRWLQMLSQKGVLKDLVKDAEGGM
ncbi:MAG: hypothetical protein M1819_006929 [Sarea resinae]|nr:MAG: hypothetical protein M1819_006929 [Sarea resinae]